MLLKVISLLVFLTLSASAVHGQGHVHIGDLSNRDIAINPETEPCGNPAAGCDVCGAGYVGCGPSVCFNPGIGEVCCANSFVCPPSHGCASVQNMCTPIPITTTLITTISTTVVTTATTTIPLVQVHPPNDNTSPVGIVTAHATPQLDTSILSNLPNTSYVAPYVSPPIPMPTTRTASTTCTTSPNTTALNTTISTFSNTSSPPNEPTTSTSTETVTPTSHVTTTSALPPRTSTTPSPTSGSVSLVQVNLLHHLYFAIATGIVVGWLLPMLGFV